MLNFIQLVMLTSIFKDILYNYILHASINILFVVYHDVTVTNFSSFAVLV